MYTHQYGFIKRKFTLDAIVRLKTIVGECRDKKVIGIFVDIKGAFDRVWWLDVLNGLRHTRCPPNLYKLITSYLFIRKVTIIDRTVQITRQQNRGCPQGSVLGPTFWNLVFDSLLEKLSNTELCHPTVYADDLTILITGNSRNQIEASSRRAVQLLDE